MEFSLFGLQASDDPIVANDLEEVVTNDNGLGCHPNARKKWKTLRDFVDERGLEDVFESIEEERNALDATLSATAAYPGVLLSMADQIRDDLIASLNLKDTNLVRPSSRNMQSPSQEKLPSIEPPPSEDMTAILFRQEQVSTEMAAHLESLAAHYDQMAKALKDKDSGGSINEDDMDGTLCQRVIYLYSNLHCLVFIRDGAELPVILKELEQSITIIQSER